MLIFITLILYFVASSCTARPSEEVDTQNVITVPPNCPPGHEYINGICREVWMRITRDQDTNGDTYQYFGIDSKNVISTPRNCKPGQQLVNGRCRDILILYGDSRNVISVPPNCRPGQQLVNGQCREIWRSTSNLVDTFLDDLRNILARKERKVENADSLKSDEFGVRNIVNVPYQCPAGWKPDALGICRPIM